jgi:protein TonB
MQKERKDKSFIKKPVYPGGIKAMRQFISEHLKYPKQAFDHKTEGTVSMKYTIDHKGTVIDTHIVSGLGHGCDEEAERVVRLFKFDVPKTRGVRVTFHKDIHIHFRLPRAKQVQQVQTQPVQAQYVYTSSATPAPATGYNYTITIVPKTKQKDVK